MTAPTMVLMNRFLPEYQFEEHHSTVVNASPGALLDAVTEVAREPDPLVGLFIALRELPGRLAGLLKGSPALPAKPFGFDNFTLLGREADAEMAFGLAGRFWQMSYGLRRVEGAADFEAVTELPKLVLNFVAQPLASGEVRLSTTTRVHCPDAASLRSFRPYWYLIRPVSGLIRMRLLKRIKQHTQNRTP